MPISHYVDYRANKALSRYVALLVRENWNMAWHGAMVWSGEVWLAIVWHGMVWYGMVWYLMACNVMVWYGISYSRFQWRCWQQQKAGMPFNTFFVLFFCVVHVFSIKTRSHGIMFTCLCHSMRPYFVLSVRKQLFLPPTFVWPAWCCGIIYLCSDFREWCGLSRCRPSRRGFFLSSNASQQQPDFLSRWCGLRQGLKTSRSWTKPSPFLVHIFSL